METKKTQFAIPQPSADPFESIHSGHFQERLNALIAINAETDREKELYRTDREKMEAALIKNPIPVKKAFAYYGMMLGFFPPAAIFYKVFPPGRELGLLSLLVFVNLVCALTGYFTGKLIGRMVSELEKRSWTLMLLTLPFIGALWGIMTGAAGGIFIFLIGAIFGSIIAAAVGGFAVPFFTIFHRLLKKGELIERNQFLPLAFGITLVITAFILGL